VTLVTRGLRARSAWSWSRSCPGTTTSGAARAAGSSSSPMGRS